MSTYGERAVGLDFNPSGDPGVQKLKELFAQIIDLCSAARQTAIGEKARLWSIAINEAQGAQMWAVKAQTWREPDTKHSGPEIPQSRYGE